MLPLKEYTKHPRLIGLALLEKSWWLFPDKLFLQLRYRFEMGKRLDLKNPKTYTEKLQWLKLYNRKPEYTTMVDKYAVKEYVAGIIGEEYIIPTLGVWDRPEDIDWDRLPNQFVLKTTHGGGGSDVVICKDKKSLNIETVLLKLKKSLKKDSFRISKEWPYKNVKKRIIAEKYMEDGESSELKDYKFYCFGGEPKVMLLASNRFTTHNFDYFDMDFNRLPIQSTAGKRTDTEYEKPECFEEMKDIARKLSKDLAHIRVDLYCSNDKAYFGELTFFDSSGYDDMSSDYWNTLWGSWIELPIE